MSLSLPHSLPTSPSLSLPLCLSCAIFQPDASSLSLFLFILSFLFLPLSLGIFLFSPLFLPLPSSTLCLAVHFASKIRRSNGPRVFILLPPICIPHPFAMFVLLHDSYLRCNPLVPPRPLSMSHSWSSIVVACLLSRSCYPCPSFYLTRAGGSFVGEATRPRRPQRGHPWYFWTGPRREAAPGPHFSSWTKSKILRELFGKIWDLVPWFDSS